jgi:hypothetical protein
MQRATPEQMDQLLTDVFSFEGVKRAAGMYHTPKATLDLIEPAMGTGSYLAAAERKEQGDGLRNNSNDAQSA